MCKMSNLDKQKVSGSHQVIHYHIVLRTGYGVFLLSILLLAYLKQKYLISVRGLLG